MKFLLAVTHFAIALSPQIVRADLVITDGGKSIMGSNSQPMHPPQPNLQPGNSSE